MSAPSLPVSEPAAEPKAAAADPSVVPSKPLREIIPRGTTLVFVAIAMAFAAAASFADFGFHGRALVGAVFCPALILLAAIDMKHRLLPTRIIYPTSLAVGLIVLASTPGDFLSHLAAGLALGGFFFVFGTVFAGSIGIGDARLGILIGLALGSKTLGAMMIAFTALLVAALYLIATRGTSARKDYLPFGPFLALGGILAFFLS